MFDHLKPTMSEGHEMMHPSVDLLDGAPNRKSPFCRLFCTLKDVRNDFFRRAPQ